MSMTWAPEAPRLKTELRQEPAFHRPPYLAHLIPADETPIDCSAEDCEREAEYWVSCGGLNRLKQSLCAVHEYVVHANWKAGRA